MDTETYLERIGVSDEVRADVGTLARLLAAHVETVPFENLSVHLQEPVRLDEEALFDKIVRRHRGGFCYELNTAFMDLLVALGFDVALVGCRVHDGTDLTHILDHVALVVTVDGRRLLVDVGFGRFARGPLDLDVAGPQPDRDGVYSVATTLDGDVDVLRDGTVLYRLETRPRRRIDMQTGAWWHATSPESPFGKSLTCSRADGDGRVTLSGDQLIRTDAAGERQEDTVPAGEVLDAYRTWFGIELERTPTVLHPPADPAP